MRQSMNVFSLKLCWKTSTRVLSTSLPRYIARCPVMLRKEDVAAMRQDYKSPVFDEGCLVAKEPFMQFDSWFKEAMKVQGEGEVNAMILATCGRDGHPTARVVLLKGYDNSGFTFFTNYNSCKGKDLEENPCASLLFYWPSLHRQIRIEGCVEKIPEKDSEEYFHSRPRTSQIGAIVSAQSSVIPNREAMETRTTELKQVYADEHSPIPKPNHWCGYKVVPVTVEFWQGQPSRLHDRIRFRKPQPDEVLDKNLTKMGSDGWVYERLAP